MIVLYGNIDQKLVNSLHGLLNCEIGELDLLLEQSIEHVSDVYTGNTYFVMQSGPCDLFRSFRGMFLYNKQLTNEWYKQWQPVPSIVNTQKWTF